MPSLQEQKSLAQDELKQLAEEGAQVEELERALKLADEQSEALQAEALEVFWREAAVARENLDSAYVEPSLLPLIHEERPDGPRRLPVPDGDRLADRMLGAWLGRCAGCMLGKPVEGWPRDHIEKLLRAAGAYPLADYFPPVEEVHRSMKVSYQTLSKLGLK